MYGFSTFVTIQLAMISCTFISALQGDRLSTKNHLEISQGYHLSLAVEKNCSLEQQVVELDHRLKNSDQVVVHLRDQYGKFERQFGELTAKLLELEQSAGRYCQLEGQVNAMEALATVPRAATASSSTVSVLTKKVDETTRMAAKVEAGVSTAQHKITSLESKMATIDRQVKCNRSRIKTRVVKEKCNSNSETKNPTRHILVLCMCTFMV